MAVKKTLVNAVPSSLDGKVTRWDLTMKYEQGTEGKDDYYTNEKRVTVEAAETSPSGTINNFTPKAEGEWTKKELEDLCPTAKWDNIFANQYESVITNPVKDPVSNNDFVIPS
tara:strand:+ start:2692 stop:3030 length:339 start_codon:yes stop_codon:yes gene_type:complete